VAAGEVTIDEEESGDRGERVDHFLATTENGQGTKAAALLSQRAMSGEYPAMPDVELARGQVINLYFSSKGIAMSRTRSVFGDVSPKQFTLVVSNLINANFFLNIYIYIFGSFFGVLVAA
jgi:hypothetical protein